MRTGATKSPVQGDPGFEDACRVPNPAHAAHVERYRKSAQRDLMRSSEMLERMQARRKRLARARINRLREKRRRMVGQVPSPVIKTKGGQTGASVPPEKMLNPSSFDPSAKLRAGFAQDRLTALHETPENARLTPSKEKTNGNGNGERNFQMEMPKNGGEKSL